MKDKIREDALDELEEVYSELKAKPSLTIPEMGQLARVGAILRRANRYPLSMAEG